MLHRRSFLSAVALTPVAASLAPLSSAQAEDDLHRAPTAQGTTPGGARAIAPVDLAPAEPISENLQLAGGFTVVRAFGPHFGALPFVLEGEGRRFQLDVLRRDAAGPSGVFDGDHVSVFVNDHGSGATDPVCERGARALGAALERRIAQEGAVLPRLASFTERRRHHPSDWYEVDFERVHAAPID